MVKLGDNIEDYLNKHNITQHQLTAAIDYIKHPEAIDHPVMDLSPASKRLRLGVHSDSHTGSKYANQPVLEDLYKHFKKDKVDAVLIAGDITEGYNRRKGQSFECELHGVDEQVKGVVERMPYIEGVEQYFILGDHDHWHFESAGVDIGHQIASQRSDMRYLGFFNAQLKVLNTTIELQHPGKGTSYALSYQVQKMIESMSGGQKPNILLVGHYHKIEQMFYRNVHAFQTGCFRGGVGITTKSGIKKICHIKKGDLVLTGKDRFKKVNKVFVRKYNGLFYTLFFGRHNHLGTQITAPEEHPILIERRGIKHWMSFKDVLVGDYLFVQYSRCKESGLKIPFYNKFHPSCNPMHLDEVRRKLSIARGGCKHKRKFEGSGWTHLKKDIIPFCHKLNEEGFKAVPVGAGIIPDIVAFKDGNIHLFELESQQGLSLERKKIKYEDSLILSFIDEIHWINTKKRKFNSNQLPFIEDDNGWIKLKINAIKTKPSRNNKVYNLEVEDDDTYFASKVLVHNCTEDQTPWMRRMNLSAHLGGWMIDLYLRNDGTINKLRSTLYPYY